MNVLDYILIIIIALAIVRAIFVIKNKGGCACGCSGGCKGNCSSCRMNSSRAGYNSHLKEAGCSKAKSGN